MDNERPKCRILCSRCHVGRHFPVASTHPGISQIQNIKFEIKKCVDCDFEASSIHDTPKLQFDHTDPTTKIDGVSALAQSNIEAAINEIDKCEVVCVNCHRLRSAKMFGYYRSPNEVNKLCQIEIDWSKPASKWIMQ